jgi:hypothetical protein
MEGSIFAFSRKHPRTVLAETTMVTEAAAIPFWNVSVTLALLRGYLNLCIHSSHKKKSSEYSNAKY